MHRVKKVSYPATYLLNGEVTGVHTTVTHTGVTQLSHAEVTGNTTVTCRGHRGSYNCHTQESQAVAHLLNGEVTGVHTTVTHRSHTAVTYRGHR